MYQLAHVANTILYRAKNERMPISPMKLQKLVYFLYAEYLYKENKPLFAERFEVWKYGPVLADIYYAFQKYRDKPIRKYMPDVSGELRAIDTDSDPELSIAFTTMWGNYSSMTGIQLSTLTHDEQGAWYAAATKRQTFLSDNDILKEMEHRNGRTPY